jgi:hypothetical protein
MEGLQGRKTVKVSCDQRSVTSFLSIPVSPSLHKRGQRRSFEDPSIYCTWQCHIVILQVWFVFALPIAHYPYECSVFIEGVITVQRPEESRIWFPAKRWCYLLPSLFAQDLSKHMPQGSSSRISINVKLVSSRIWDGSSVIQCLPACMRPWLSSQHGNK